MNKTRRSACADIPPSELDSVLSCSYTKRCLMKAGITTINQLMSLSTADLLQIRGIGKTIANNILKAQEDYKNAMQQ